MEAITTAQGTELKDSLNEIFKDAKIRFLDDDQKKVKINIDTDLSFDQNQALAQLGEFTTARSGPGLVLTLTVF